MNRTRRSGFTLIELMISIAIAATLMAIAYPAYATMRAREAAQNAAQEFAAHVRRATAESLKGEQYVAITTTDSGFTVWRVTNTPGGLPSWTPNTWVRVSQGTFADGPARISTGSNTVLPVGPKGWPIKGGNEPAGSGGPFVNTNILQSDSRGQFYPYRFSGGAGAWTVQVYVTGLVVVVGPT